MGPGCAVADVHLDGVTTVWSGGQKPHALQQGFAELLRVPPEKVRVIWVEDAGSYGRPGFEDAAADAVLLSRAVGKPVRVQWSREDMTAWGTKGPAVACEMSAALDAHGEVSAFQFTSRAFSGGQVSFLPATAGNFLGAQLTGIPNTSGVDEFAQWGEECVAYAFPECSRGCACGSRLFGRGVSTAHHSLARSRKVRPPRLRLNPSWTKSRWLPVPIPSNSDSSIWTTSA